MFRTQVEGQCLSELWNRPTIVEGPASLPERILNPVAPSEFNVDSERIKDQLRLPDAAITLTDCLCHVRSKIQPIDCLW